MTASAQVAALAGGHMPGGPVMAGFLLMAVATVLGAWLALCGRGPREAWLGAAAGTLLMVAVLHLLPDAWSAARGARIWQPVVPAAALGSFVLSGLAARRGCACGSDRYRNGSPGLPLRWRCTGSWRAQRWR